MIAMLDTNHSLEDAEKELGYPVEQLFSPLTRRADQCPDRKFAIDNGAFAGFKAKGFLALLERLKDQRHRCRFVAVPDIVGSARRTLEVFDHWQPLLNHWPLALVAQDGQADLAIPWDHIDAIFIGGTTDFKDSDASLQIVKAAKALDKWVHIGRVNTRARFEAFLKAGADSCDGTGLARYSRMRNAIGHPKLSFDSENQKCEVI